MNEVWARQCLANLYGLFTDIFYGLFIRPFYGYFGMVVTNFDTTLPVPLYCTTVWLYCMNHHHHHHYRTTIIPSYWTISDPAAGSLLLGSDKNTTGTGTRYSRTVMMMENSLNYTGIYPETTIIISVQLHTFRTLSFFNMRFQEFRSGATGLVLLWRAPPWYVADEVPTPVRSSYEEVGWRPNAIVSEVVVG